MTLSEELKWRGFINQTTIKDLSVLDNHKWIFYHGYDASADSQQVGNLAAMMLDRLFIRHGAKAIILLGGATTQVGDPGGKSDERELQSEVTIESNIKAAKQQIQQVFGDLEISIVNNLEWYKDMPVLTFLRDVGKHFSMTPLVQRDYIAKRMGADGQGISYAEFSYTLLQGYDFLHLHQTKGVNLQLAGSDQWGNGLSGVDLIQRVTGDEAHILTLPLIINQATGVKFGKSENGAVWLSALKTSPTKFYQFWINLPDEGISQYLKIYTDLDKEKIDNVLDRHLANPSSRLAQATLAFAATELVHGTKAAQSAKQVTELLVGQNDLGSVDDQTINELKTEIDAATVPLGTPFDKLLVTVKLASSLTEGRRLLREGAIYINNKKTNQTELRAADFKNNRLLIRRGKAYKDSALVELQK